MAKFQIKNTQNDDLWDEIVQNSPQGTLFQYSVFLKNYGKAFERYFIYKNREIKGGFALTFSKQKKEIELDNLMIYTGLFFYQKDEKKAVKRKSEEFEITEFFIEFLEQFDKKKLQFSPFFEDFRPFLWHNYHEKNGKYSVDLRYTSFFNINDSSFFEKMDTVRQRNYKKAEKEGFFSEIAEKSEIKQMVSFYEKLMEAQNSNVENEFLLRLEALLTSLVENNLGLLVVTKNSEQIPLYYTFWGIDNKRAYYLYGAGNPEIMDSIRGTKNFIDSFNILKEKYFISEVDLEGVNSPNRGWYKLSFGGELLPYFCVSKN
jgi:hypothetical protein